MAESKEQTVRMPPQALEAEMATLGSMMIDKHAANVAFEILDESCFHKDAHRRIFIAAGTLNERGEGIDALTVSSELEKMQDLEKVGGYYYLTELVERIPSAANIEQYCHIVLDRALARKLITITNEIQQECYDSTEESYDLIDMAEKKIFSLSERRNRKEFTPLKDILGETFNVIESYHHRLDGITGVPTGFKELDNLLSGLQNSELIILAARPSVGKTALALNIARNAAQKAIPIGIFSLEMASQQLVMRFLCTEARVDAHLVRTGKLPQEQWGHLSHVSGVLASSPIFIDDTPGMNIMEIRSKARRLKAEHNIGLLIIDYLQLIHGVGRIENRQVEIAQISQALKALSKELAIPILAISQLSRYIESREGGKPRLSDLRESGAIEQDADVVMFIARSSGSGPEEPGQDNLAEIIVAKQRNGPTDSVYLLFHKEYLLFTARDTVHKEYPVVTADNVPDVNPKNE
ncbi:replicative DNA helicase [candidate division KSB1 bacterium]|nr:replicative DNA helicase [candidate division KSB1 bacterium]